MTNTAGGSASILGANLAQQTWIAHLDTSQIYNSPWSPEGPGLWSESGL